MAAQGTDAQLRRLFNLFDRGRRLHYENANVLAARILKARLPTPAPPMSDMVYKAMQLIFALTFIEERNYLDPRIYDPFTDQLFVKIAGGHRERLHGLVNHYAKWLAEPDKFSEVIAQDLCAALLGEVVPTYVAALANTPAAVQRTTQLYCAMTFNDRAMVARLQ